MLRSLVACLLVVPALSAQAAVWSAGTPVQASPTQSDREWRPCVVRTGPGQNDIYQLDCAGTDYSVPGRWIRAGDGTSTAAAAAPAANARWPRGGTVLASPAQSAASWQRCEVRDGPLANDYYRLECADEIGSADGGRHLTVLTVSLPGRWIRADDPAFRPELQLAAARVGAGTALSRIAPAARPGGGAQQVATGDYRCWAFSSPRPALDFSITGAGRYTASDGSEGAFEFDPGTGAIQFDGYLEDVLPNGFTARYHEPHGRPTVSFRSAGGAEASFCERT